MILPAINEPRELLNRINAKLHGESRYDSRFAKAAKIVVSTIRDAQKKSVIEGLSNNTPAADAHALLLPYQLTIQSNREDLKPNNWKLAGAARSFAHETLMAAYLKHAATNSVPFGEILYDPHKIHLRHASQLRAEALDKPDEQAKLQLRERGMFYDLLGVIDERIEKKHNYTIEFEGIATNLSAKLQVIETLYWKDGLRETSPVRDVQSGYAGLQRFVQESLKSLENVPTFGTTYARDNTLIRDLREAALTVSPFGPILVNGPNVKYLCDKDLRELEN